MATNANTTVDEEEVLETDGAESEPEEDALPAPARQHGVWIVSLNIGSCNGCDQMIQALLAPRYQLARRGITYATSPRHADIILLAGALTQRTLEPVQRVIAQVPDPHAIIAVGDCVLNGSVFAGSPEIIPNAADLLGVNVEIAGNPPTPVQILQAIEEAARLLDAVDVGSTTDIIEDEEEDGDEDADMEVVDEEEEDA